MMLLIMGIHRQLFAKMRLRLKKYRFLQVVLPPVVAGVIIGMYMSRIACLVLSCVVLSFGSAI